MYAFEQLIVLTGTVIVWALMGMFGLVGIPYIVLRLRDARHKRRDPQLGVKCVMHALLTLAVMLILVGLTVVMIDVVEDDYNVKDWDSEYKRAGLALLASGGLHLVGLLVALFMFTNERRWPRARRAYSGIRFATCGIVLMIALTGTFLIWFQKRPTGFAPGAEGIITFAVAAMVFGFATTIEMLLLVIFSRLRDEPDLVAACLMCDYPLSASVAAGHRRCPECGTPLTGEQLRDVRELVGYQVNQEIDRSTDLPVDAPLPEFDEIVLEDEEFEKEVDPSTPPRSSESSGDG